ncbi:MAG: hypothetical protein NTV86_06720 [Planctomycetota bacterium]|nr:hypothetical protein [Planctomycetota bacterium]
MERNNTPAGPSMTLGVPLAGPGAVPPVSRPSPLSEEDFLAVRRGGLEYLAIRRTIKTARTSAVVTLVIGALALLVCALSFAWVAIVTAVGVCVVGAVEFAGAGRLRQGQLRAPRMLAINQLCFLALIVVYCVIQMVATTSAEIREAALSPGFRSALAGMPDMQKTADQLAPLVFYGLYVGTILLSALVQGGLAGRYHVCGRRLAAFTGHTPPWVCRVIREVHAD